jgi:TonB family protein
MRIRVRVRVNDRGDVVSAESLAERGDTLTDFLSRAAIEAARQWQFIPAREGSRNVASETVLDFQFVK